VGQTQAWMPACLLRITHSPDDMSLESDGGMIYWQGKTEKLGEKPVPVLLCPPQIRHGLTRARTRASVVRGRRLTAWVMTLREHSLNVFYSFSSTDDDKISAYVTFRLPAGPAW